MTEKKRPVWIPVVIGLIKRNDQVLLGQRPHGGVLPGFWDFPGGKIEEDESPTQALARELQEELGIEVKVGELRFAGTHHYKELGKVGEMAPHFDGVHILLLFYDIVAWRGEPKPLCYADIQWLTVSELHHLDIPEANRVHLDKIMESISIK